MSSVKPMDGWILSLTAVIGGVGVIAAAIGAHPPEGFLAEADSQSAWNSAALFLLLHVLVILGVANIPQRSLDPFRLSAIAFLIGIFLFSGSIFVLSAGGPGFLGPITPLGGLLLIFGWFFLAFRLAKPASSSDLLSSE